MFRKIKLTATIHSLNFSNIILSQTISTKIFGVNTIYLKKMQQELIFERSHIDLAQAQLKFSLETWLEVKQAEQNIPYFAANLMSVKLESWSNLP